MSEGGYLDLDTFHQVFVVQIIGDVRFCLDQRRCLAAAQLLLAGIDTAAGLERPASREDTTRREFVSWADKYLRLKGPNYELRGIDIYAARCGFLHGYTPEARLVREGKAKPIARLDAGRPPVFANDDKSIVLVSLPALGTAFSRGLADMLVRIGRDRQLSELVNRRLAGMFHPGPVSQEVSDAMRSYREAEDEKPAVQVSDA